MLQELFTPSSVIPKGTGFSNTYGSYRLDSAGLETATLEDIDIGIFGIAEDTNAVEKGAARAPEEIRKALYMLAANCTGQTTVRDLGNLQLRASVSDTYSALSYVIGEMERYKVLPVILGGSQELTVPVLKGFQKAKTGLNLLSVDYAFDWDEEEDFNDRNYLNYLLYDNQVILDTYTNLGNQAYYIPPGRMQEAEKNTWFSMRLGALRSAITETEPFIRHADFVSFDWGAIKNAFLPGYGFVSPNGIEPHEACQMARYAGMSDRNNGLGIFNFIPGQAQLAGPALIAQMVWYYIDGVLRRTNDYPGNDKGDTVKFIVSFSDFDYSIIFYQSKRSRRWWMEVPAAGNTGKIVPCSHNDYRRATRQEIPDLWWRYYHKFSKRKS